MKKVISIMLALFMLFAFAACKDTDDETPETNALVNGSKEEIVDFFNQKATSIKEYAGKVTVRRTQGTTSRINSITGGNAVSGSFKPLLPNDFPRDRAEKVFESAKDSDGNTLASFLPAKDILKYNISAESVESASCVEQGDGLKVSVTLASESGTGFQFVPEHHSKCFDILSLKEKDFEPFKITTPTVNYEGGTYTIVLDADGVIRSINIMVPVNFVCKVDGGTSADADFTCIWRQRYVFTY